MGEILIALQLIVFVIGGGKFFYWLRHQMTAMKEAIGAQDATIKAQSEAMRAQTQTLNNLQELLKTMQAVLESTDEQKMLARVKAYKEFVDYEKDAALKKVLLDKLEEREQLSPNTHSKLLGLSSVEIWGLTDFRNKRIPQVITEMKPVQKVAARSLVDAGLLRIETINGERQVHVTELGEKLLQVADSILD